jgi:hypothetical protein
MGCACEDGAWVAPLGREAHAADAVSDELRASKANTFTEGEATTRQAFSVVDDGEL